MRTAVRVVGACIALLSSISFAQQAWSPVGSGEMRWTVFKLYEITLFTENGRYQAEQYPQALEIRYHRDIAREDLVSATRDQWEKLGFPVERHQNWLVELQSLWPDIRENDRLRIEVDRNGINTFFHNGKQLGGIDSKEFSEAFLAIWLSTETTRPELRRKLIGDQSGNV